MLSFPIPITRSSKNMYLTPVILSNVKFDFYKLNKTKLIDLNNYML